MNRLFLIMGITFSLAVLALAFNYHNNLPLISRKVLFGNPEKAAFRVSPDGRYISYLAPENPNDEKSVLNIWVQPIDRKEPARQLTAYTDRSIMGYFWSYNSSEIFFVKDSQGDENWRLYGINISTKETSCYTPFEKVQTRFIPHYNEDSPFILLSLNKEKPELHDVYTFHCDTKELKLICKNPGGVSQWLADRNLNIRAAVQETKTGAQQLLLRKDNASPWEIVRTYSQEDAGVNDCTLVGFSSIHNCMYLVESKDSDTAQFVRFDVDSKKVIVIAHNEQYDIDDVYIQSDTEEPESFSYTADKSVIKLLKEDSAYARVVRTFGEKHPGNLHIISSDRASKKWIVFVERDTFPGATYLYDDSTGLIEELSRNRPEIKEEYLASTQPIVIKSRDGLSLQSYLTLPKSSSQTNLPLILLVHGGPWARDSWGFSPQVQWLANRGYAVLQINFRGSTGFGKKFVMASYKEWGGKMHDDLIDGVNWAIDSKIADPQKIAIYGGSYGGYAALCGAAFTPDTFCCAVDVVGPSNLISLLKSLPPYWKLYTAKNYKQIGHPENDAEFLRSHSPLFSVNAIKIPLFIAQGAQDPRVSQNESEQMVAALKDRGIEHEYLLFPDEGHGCVNAHNKMKLFTHIEKFFAQHLKGRYEK
jgi:dipeptidyl aminopeptidase/acylaminoacyl peptidase